MTDVGLSDNATNDIAIEKLKDDNDAKISFTMNRYKSLLENYCDKKYPLTNGFVCYLHGKLLEPTNFTNTAVKLRETIPHYLSLSNTVYVSRSISALIDALVTAGSLQTDEKQISIFLDKKFVIICNRNEAHYQGLTNSLIKLIANQEVGPDKPICSLVTQQNPNSTQMQQLELNTKPVPVVSTNLCYSKSGFKAKSSSLLKPSQTEESDSKVTFYKQIVDQLQIKIKNIESNHQNILSQIEKKHKDDISLIDENNELKMKNTNLSRENEDVMSSLIRENDELKVKNADLSRENTDVMNSLNRENDELKIKNADLSRENKEVMNSLIRENAELKMKNVDLSRENTDVMNALIRENNELKIKNSDFSRENKGLRQQLFKAKQRINKLIDILPCDPQVTPSKKRRKHNTGPVTSSVPVGSSAPVSSEVPVRSTTSVSSTISVSSTVSVISTVGSSVSVCSTKLISSTVPNTNISACASSIPVISSMPVSSTILVSSTVGSTIPVMSSVPVRPSSISIGSPITLSSSAPDGSFEVFPEENPKANFLKGKSSDEIVPCKSNMDTAVKSIALYCGESNGPHVDDEMIDRCAEKTISAYTEKSIDAGTDLLAMESIDICDQKSVGVFAHAHEMIRKNNKKRVGAFAEKIIGTCNQKSVGACVEEFIGMKSSGGHSRDIVEKGKKKSSGAWAEGRNSSHDQNSVCARAEKLIETDKSVGAYGIKSTGVFAEKMNVTGCQKSFICDVKLTGELICANEIKGTCAEKSSCMFDKKLTKCTDQRIGTRSKKSINACAEQSIGTHSEKSISARAEQRIVTRSKKSINACAEQSIGTHSEKKSISACAEQRIETRSKKSLNACSEQRIGTRSQKSLNACAEQRIGTHSEKSISACAEQRIETCSKKSINACAEQWICENSDKAIGTYNEKSTQFSEERIGTSSGNSVDSLVKERIRMRNEKSFGVFAADTTFSHADPFDIAISSIENSIKTNNASDNVTSKPENFNSYLKIKQEAKFENEIESTSPIKIKQELFDDMETASVPLLGDLNIEPCDSHNGDTKRKKEIDTMDIDPDDSDLQSSAAPTSNSLEVIRSNETNSPLTAPLSESVAQCAEGDSTSSTTNNFDKRSYLQPKVKVFQVKSNSTRYPILVKKPQQCINRRLESRPDRTTRRMRNKIIRVDHPYSQGTLVFHPI